MHLDHVTCTNYINTPTQNVHFLPVSYNAIFQSRNMNIFSHFPANNKQV